MIEFTLFGFPIRIRPVFWLGMFLIGGGLSIREVNDLVFVALFAIAGTITILIHELGHAYAGRKVADAAASIELVFLGGYTQYFHAHFKGWGRAISTAAGPLATLIPGIVAAAVVYVFYVDSWKLLVGLLVNPYIPMGLQAQSVIEYSTAVQLYFWGCMIFTSFWWALLNLLPVFPLDGGQIMAEFVKSPRKLHQLSFVFAVVLGALSFFFFGFILTLFMGLFAWMNYRAMKDAPY